MGNLDAVIGKGPDASYRAFAKSNNQSIPTSQQRAQGKAQGKLKNPFLTGGNLDSAIGQGPDANYTQFLKDEQQQAQQRQQQLAQQLVQKQQQAKAAPKQPPPAKPTGFGTKTNNPVFATQNFLKQALTQAGHVVADTGKGIGRIAAIPYDAAKTVPASITGNKTALNNANTATDKDIGTLTGFTQFFPRAVVQARNTVGEALGGNAGKGSLSNFTPHGTVEQAILGKQPIQSFQQVYKGTRAQSGTQSAVVKTGLNAIVDALAFKGGIDTAAKVKGSLPSLKTTKEVNTGGTVPNEQARAFFNSPNPSIPPATSDLLAKALADNKAQFVQELKGGQGVSVSHIQTVPTVYGKLLNIIKGKTDKGQPLTPAEDSVVKAATANPKLFTGEATPAAPPAAAPVPVPGSMPALAKPAIIAEGMAPLTKPNVEPGITPPAPPEAGQAAVPPGAAPLPPTPAPKPAAETKPTTEGDKLTELLQHYEQSPRSFDINTLIAEHGNDPAALKAIEDSQARVKAAAVQAHDVAQKQSAIGQKFNDAKTVGDIRSAEADQRQLAGKAVFSSTSGSSTPKAKPTPKPEPKPPAEVSAPVKKFISTTAQHKEVAGQLGDQLHALGGHSIADNIALSHLFKEAKKLSIKPADWTAIYHYAEDRSSPITPEQKTLFDSHIKPLQDGINDMRTKMGLKEFKSDEFIHRIAQGHGSALERFLQGDNKTVSAGNVLKKTSDSMKSRTWMKLVDGQGHSKIVAIKSPKDKVGKTLGPQQVTEFKNGQKTPMGALKRKIPAPVKEFTDPVLMSKLEEIAKGLGISHERTNVPLKRGDNAAGVHYVGTNLIKTKTASAPDTLLHEIGHYIDHKYNMQGAFLLKVKDQTSKADKEEARTINQELRALADKRVGAEGAPKSFSKYVRSGDEKIAVMFQAYLHAPDIFRAVAPTAYQKFEAFMTMHSELKPILNIEKSLQLGSQTIGDVRHAGEFIDKNNKKWQIVNATTKEIEANSKTRYFKQPLVSSAIDYLQTRQALRASQFLDKWKSDPSFLHNPETGTGIAVKSDAKAIPDGWKTTSAPQFRGYHFEPRVAEVLDDFAKVAQRGDPLGAFTGMNNFLRTTIFYNPLMHVPNIATHAVMRRGVSGVINPVKAYHGVTSSVQAINEVIHKGPLYQSLLREGAPLMSFDRAGLSKMIGGLMDDAIKNDSTVSKLAKAAGYASKANFVKAWYRVSSGVTWSSHDFFMLQAMIEEMQKGLTAQEAIHRVTAHIPDYRVSTRFFGSRSLKTTLSNHNVTMFLPYHYGILKSYANVAREIAGKVPRGDQEAPGAGGKAKTAAGGVDKLVMAGVIMFFVYPQLDKLAKAVFHDTNAIVRRAGPFTFPYAIYRMLAGKQTAQQTATTVLPVPPGTKGFVQLGRNRDDLNNQIYNPGDLLTNPVQAGKDIGKYAGGTVAPISQTQKTSKSGVKSLVENLSGVRSPNDLKTYASKLLNQQLNLGVQSKAQQRINDQKNKARDQIASDKGDSLAKQLVADGVMKQAKLKAFEQSAKWTPLQRTFDALSAVNKLAVLQKATPQQRSQLGDVNTIKAQAAKAANNAKGSAANRVAAKQIVDLLNGKGGYGYSDGQQTTHESVLQSIGAYASAFKTSPLTAFNRIFTGQRIVRVNSGAIIVQRMPQSTSAGIRVKLGASKASEPMQLDHIVPLELGGSNAVSNLQLIPKSQDDANNPIENYLGSQLRAGKLNAKQATKLILDYKHGKISAAAVYKH